ncbi:carboxypeptidase-like regulatory domain-containing protein [uncultured Parabacteroides sp.]|uniref:carboxypeptidase-like regulatory domain-containing protein n=1 Tax=uncultured Parabacteroides sp. TaxID=512312 RepID=UPI00260429FF|nr:carboxypeptidase-like regulatory domain-containing protein [uncultured Parabacteroides sp.]
MRNRILLLLCFLCVGLQAFAQISISGKVVDAGGMELPGVNVMVKGTTVGTLTDGDGKFTIPDVPGGSNAVLVFSYVGFQTQEIKVGNAKSLTVKLQEDNMALDEVVVVGYGTARKKDVSGAISNVRFSDSDITALPNPNAIAALSSKVAGMKYAPTNSAGGDNMGSMTLRGKNAIPTAATSDKQSVNAPLLIIDGVISFGSINEINTNDVQSIDVLKDASAAAIYGSRAANGVIIITTKKS